MSTMIIVHKGTGTIIDANDDVWVVDPDTITDPEVLRTLEEGDEYDVREIAVHHGRRIDSEVLEMSYRNCMVFTPTALRVEVEENSFIRNRLTHEVTEWIKSADRKAFDKIADFIMNDELLWENYCSIVAECINAVHRLATEGESE